MITFHDTALILRVVLPLAVAVAVIGALTLRAIRRRSLGAALAVVVATAVAVIAGGVMVLGASMLVSGHALSVLVAVLVVGTATGLAAAAMLGRSVVRASRALSAAATQMGSDEPLVIAAPLATSELLTIGAALTGAHARLVDARHREAALEGSRRELVAWVSHDLRTPLAGMRAMVEALEDGVAADPADYHHRLRVELDRLSRMVDDLFELSRIHAGSLQLSLQQVDLGDLVSDTLAAVDPVARSKGVLLSGGGGGVGAVQVDAHTMNRVLANLVLNAVRHTPADGAVTVTYGRDSEQRPTIEVRDACGGIPEQDLARVFDVGFRGSWARTPADGDGAGLGLAIARGIVEAHHGQISLENSGPGCRFVVTLPG